MAVCSPCNCLRILKMILSVAETREVGGSSMGGGSVLFSDQMGMGKWCLSLPLFKKKKKKKARPVPPHLLWVFPPVSNGNGLIALEYLVLCLFTHCHDYKSHRSRVPGRHFTCPLPSKASQTLTHFPHFCWTELGSWGINEATAPQPLSPS